jgi:aspartate dehydrogenase
MLKIGVVGCGVIGSEICRALDQNQIAARLAAINDVDKTQIKTLLAELKPGPTAMELDELVKAVDLVVEATYRHVVSQIIEQALQAGADVMVMSVGGLLAHYDRFLAQAKEKGCRIYVPSGAIAGLDMVKGAAEARLDRVTITTCKPPKGLKGAPYIEQNRIDLESLTEKTLVFSGSAEEAVPAFPANINVAAALSLAGIGPQKTQVRIFADPDIKVNSHTVEIEGDFGKMTSKCELLAHSRNPKTSLMAFLSAISLIRRITSPVVIGT